MANQFQLGQLVTLLANGESLQLARQPKLVQYCWRANLTNQGNVHLGGKHGENARPASDIEDNLGFVSSDFDFKVSRDLEINVNTLNTNLALEEMLVVPH